MCVGGGFGVWSIGSGGGEPHYLLILKIRDSSLVINSLLHFRPCSISTIQLHNIGIGRYETSVVFPLESGTRQEGLPLSKISGIILEVNAVR